MKRKVRVSSLAGARSLILRMLLRMKQKVRVSSLAGARSLILRMQSY